MSAGNSRIVETNQTGIHEQLGELVNKYLLTQNRKPIQSHTQQAFDSVLAWLGDWQGDIIFDSCCGVGLSTIILAQRFPQARVIGIDKSEQRVGKHSHHCDTFNNTSQNYILVRADVIDFWRLAVRQKMQLSHHFLLYPNPYPKKTQIQKRWHGSSSFLDIIALGGVLEVRSNWLLYLEECQFVLKKLGHSSTLSAIDAFEPGFEPLTLFEKKYMNSGQVCYQLETH